MKTPKTITIYDGTVLTEGRKYKWSGYMNSHLDYTWTDFMCKIKLIEGQEITVHDYVNMVDYIYTDNGFIKVKAKFVECELTRFEKIIRKIFR